MGIDRAHYHGWHGPLGSPWRSCLALVRVALLQIFRRKLVWALLALGLLQFLQFFSIIYAVTQVDLSAEQREWIVNNFGFSAESDRGKESGYTLFMQRQSLVVMLLLAFSGSMLVGSDFQQKSLPFYLSRRIDRRHYIAGKLLAVAVLVSLLTTLPALLLFGERGLFTSSWSYWVDNWHVVAAVLIYGLVLSTTLGVLLVTLSAYLQRTAPIAITWCSIFLLLSRFASLLSDTVVDSPWKLLDPWHDMHEVGKLLFRVELTAKQTESAMWALAILLTICGLCLAALVRRVRAVDVVQ